MRNKLTEKTNALLDEFADAAKNGKSLAVASVQTGAAYWDTDRRIAYKIGVMNGVTNTLQLLSGEEWTIEEWAAVAGAVVSILLNSGSRD